MRAAAGSAGRGLCGGEVREGCVGVVLRPERPSGAISLLKSVGTMFVHAWGVPLTHPRRYLVTRGFSGGFDTVGAGAKEG